MSGLTKLLDGRPWLGVLICRCPLTLHLGRTGPASAGEHSSSRFFDRPSLSSHFLQMAFEQMHPNVESAHASMQHACSGQAFSSPAMTGRSSATVAPARGGVDSERSLVMGCDGRLHQSPHLRECGRGILKGAEVKARTRAAISASCCFSRSCSCWRHVIPAQLSVPSSAYTSARSRVPACENIGLMIHNAGETRGQAQREQGTVRCEDLSSYCLSS